MTDTMQKNKNIAEVLQKTAKNSKKQKILTVSGVFILFLAVFLFYVYCSVFDKRIRIYYDELRYLHIAKNLWLDHSLKIYEYDTDFQKILYSVFLAPFYSIKNSVLRIKAISAFNAFLAASSVFPGYLIAKKITSDRKIIFISLVILALSPDMCYSMIFMSETLYLPLGLWQIYLFIRLFEAETLRKKIILALLCGAFNYFLYLTKEVAVIFPISFFIISVIGAFYEKKNAKQKIITFSAYFIAFISFFLVFKLTLFSGMGNSYDQTNLNQIGTLYKFEFFIYSLIYNFIFLLVGLFWFPVVYPAFKVTKMKKSNRNLYVFLMIAFFLCMAVVGFTISVREDLGKEWVRQHQRYYSIFFMPFFILFADSAINCRNEIENHKNAYYSILSGITSAFLMIVFFFIKKTGNGTAADNTTLKYFDIMTKKLFEDKTEGKSQIPFNNGEILVKMAFAVFIVAVTVLLLKKFRKTAVFVTFSVVFAVSCLNIGICVETFRDSHGITHYQQDEAYRLDNYTRNLKGNMLFITDEKFDDNSKIIDTYLSKDYVTATKDDFLSLEDENGVVDLKIKKFTVVSGNEEKKYLDFDAFDYVITDSNIEFDENSAEKIDIEGVYFVKVYKLYDKNRICAKINEN